MSILAIIALIVMFTTGTTLICGCIMWLSIVVWCKRTKEDFEETLKGTMMKVMLFFDKLDN